MSEEERIKKEVGISNGDTWDLVLVRVLLWLKKKFTESKCECKRVPDCFEHADNCCADWCERCKLAKADRC